MLEARWLRSGLIAVLVVFALSAAGTARAQNRDVAFDAVVSQPRGLPDLPPNGAWGEVINATSRWIVIQNHAGQQFPIAIEDITEFLIRWPSSLDALGPGSLVEAIGPNVGSNTIRTDHIDVFEGTDRTLVSPTYNDRLPNNMVVTTLDPGFNRFMNAFDVAGAEPALWLGVSRRPGPDRDPLAAARRGQPGRHQPAPPLGPGEQPRHGHPRQRRPDHRLAGHPRPADVRPQGRLRLPAADADDAEGAGGVATGAVQAGPVRAVQSEQVRTACPWAGQARTDRRRRHRVTPRRCDLRQA